MHPISRLPAEWQHPHRAVLPTGHHLRPLRAADVDLHLRAVLGSQERLWSLYGPLWGWPPADLGVELDREDLARQEDETARGASFGYALFDAGETELLGRVTIRPAHSRTGADDVTWWVVDWLVGGPIEAALNAFVPRWVAAEWPLLRPRYNQTARRSAP
jgi:hypothetical protein